MEPRKADPKEPQRTGPSEPRQDPSKVWPGVHRHLAGHASITMTLDRYSHWMPSMGRNTAEGIDEALG